MRTIRDLSLVAAVSGLLLGAAALALADDAHHQDAAKDAPKAAEPAPETKAPAAGKGMGMMGDGMMGKMMGGGGMMMGNCPMGSQKSADALKTELGITDAQKSVWEVFAGAEAKTHADMQGMQQSMLKMMDAKSPVERLEARIGAMGKHLAALEELKAPLAALYAALSDEQKRKADTALAGIGCMM